MKEIERQNFGFTRVAAVSPLCKIADTVFNAREIIKKASEAAQNGASLVVFPELCITCYSIRDLVSQDLILRKAEQALHEIILRSQKIPAVLVVGLPMEIDCMLINVAAVIDRGILLGLVPKSYLPESGEFEEGRWYRPGHDLMSAETSCCGQIVPVGANTLFKSKNLRGATLAVEICEDAWVPVPPGAFHALAGATIIVNPSASNELVGKAAYRRDLVKGHSSTRICAYVYASCGPGESTTDIVFGGHCLIAENNAILAESELFEQNGTTIMADIDLQKIMHDRVASKGFGENTRILKNYSYRVVPMNLAGHMPKDLIRPVHAHPFTSESPDMQKSIVDAVFNIQMNGLIKRLDSAKTQHVVLGLSGGKDSTLAYLACIKAFEKMDLPLANIHAISMPGPGTSESTRALARKLGSVVSFEEISISDGAAQLLKKIGHDGKTQDITYENAQARYRTFVLFQKCNQIGALLVGTGDLSEIANGYCTYNGDHMSGYNVNCGVPKGLVKYMIRHVSGQFKNGALGEVLENILSHPDSAELTHVAADAKVITQITEDKVGPYELAEFFLYEFVRWGSEPKKILHLATIGFKGIYAGPTIRKWLRFFYIRFFGNQWKRSAVPDGPQVGSISLSPRGRWRMPSDAEVRMWLDELS